METPEKPETYDPASWSIWPPARCCGPRVLVATGLRDELPELPGVRERWGKDLLHCPYCHGLRGPRPAARGARHRPGLGRPGAAGAAVVGRRGLLPDTLDVTAEERERLTARGVPIVDGVVWRLVVGGDRLRGVELAEGQVVARAAVFVFPRMVAHDTLLTCLGCDKDEDGWVITDPSGRISR